MKVLVVGDCHGEKPSLKDSWIEECDIILATGDFCGGGDEMRSLMFESIDEDWEWYDEMGKDEARKKVQESLNEGEKILEYLNGLGKPVFVVPGNWDWSGEIYGDWEYLKKNRFNQIVQKYENIININYGLNNQDGVSIIGYGPCSGPEIPQYEDDKPETEEELEEQKQDYRETKEQISELFQEAEEPIIFLSHNVPHDTPLDMIDNEDSPAHGRHYGSIVVREIIQDFQPLVNVAGHMHEGYGKHQLQDTFCLNAGLNATQLVKLSLEDKTVERIDFNPELE